MELKRPIDKAPHLLEQQTWRSPYHASLKITFTLLWLRGTELTSLRVSMKLSRESTWVLAAVCWRKVRYLKDFEHETSSALIWVTGNTFAAIYRQLPSTLWEKRKRKSYVHCRRETAHFNVETAKYGRQSWNIRGKLGSRDHSCRSRFT